MRQAWHIFKKDARRLWWEITVTLGILALLAREDRWRSDLLPGPLESLLHLLLPAAWCYLLMLAVHQEPLVGDRQFWITRPYRWPALLSAKALFAVAFVSCPTLIVDSVVVAGRGFSPFAHLGPLLWKQVAVAAALLVPAAALASITRTVGQFFTASIPIAVAAAFLVKYVEAWAYPWIPQDIARRGIALGVLAAVGALIVLAQYSRRSTAWMRAAGVAAVVSAALLYTYLPRKTTFALGSVFTTGAASRVSIRLPPEDAQQPPGRWYSPPNRATVHVPLVIWGLAPATHARFETLATEVEAPDGRRWTTVRAPTQSRERDTIESSIRLEEDSRSGWMTIVLMRSVYEGVASRRVTLRGKLGAVLYRYGDTVTMPIGATSHAVPGLGQCSGQVFDDPLGRQMLKVVCESPSRLPILVPVRLRIPTRTWNQRLGDSYTDPLYPSGTMLSPLYRLQTFFHISEELTERDGSRWLVPRADLSNATVEITPVIPAGRGVVSYELRDVYLSKFLVKKR